MISKSVIRRTQHQSSAPLFRNQAAIWLERGKTRNRKPLRPKTAKNYESMLSANLIPIIGDLPLDAIGNTVLNDVASKLKQKGLGAGSIQLNLSIIKDIRGSAKNSEGEQLYPYKWDAETIDAPEVDKKAQKRPVASAQAVQAAFECECATGGTKSLVAVLAGTGMRIQEALALTIGPDDGKSTVWLADQSKIIVRVQRDGTDITAPKTPAGRREIDLCAKLNDYLKTLPFILHMFPRSEGFYRKRLIHCGIIGGFHSLRRFRVTYLRSQAIPDSMIHFWVGHEDPSVTGLYTEHGTQIQERKNLAEKAGIGFEL